MDDQKLLIVILDKWERDYNVGIILFNVLQ